MTCAQGLWRLLWGGPEVGVLREWLYASKKERKDETKAAEKMLNMADVIVKKYPAGKTKFNLEDIIKKNKVTRKRK